MPCTQSPKTSRVKRGRPSAVDKEHRVKKASKPDKPDSSKPRLTAAIGKGLDKDKRPTNQLKKKTIFRRMTKWLVQDFNFL